MLVSSASVDARMDQKEARIRKVVSCALLDEIEFSAWLWVPSMVAHSAVHSAARSAGRWVALMGVMLAARWTGLKASLTVVTTAATMDGCSVARWAVPKDHKRQKIKKQLPCLLLVVEIGRF